MSFYIFQANLNLICYKNFMTKKKESGSSLFLFHHLYSQYQYRNIFKEITESGF